MCGRVTGVEYEDWNDTHDLVDRLSYGKPREGFGDSTDWWTVDSGLFSDWDVL